MKCWKNDAKRSVSAIVLIGLFYGLDIGASLKNPGLASDLKAKFRVAIFIIAVQLKNRVPVYKKYTKPAV
jgi:hypothetical protein